ncbi:MAG: hypothetical protein F4053_06360 [Proteobacteria bacterium]|nr:hypothetical protein [Pseudomonadota bacterium]MYJ95211.1 hypothetical protein [Pseudomonadota bacterium]
MNNGRLDRALLLAILAAMGGLYWQMISMNARLSSDIAAVSERLGRVGTHLEYIVPRPADPPAGQSPID